MGEYISADPCPKCQGRTFSRIYVSSLGGRLVPGLAVRCINCKFVMGAPASDQANETDLPQGWLSEALTNAEHEVDRWGPALRDSLEAAMREPLPTPSPAGAREEIARVIDEWAEARSDTLGVLTCDDPSDLAALLDSILAIAPGETEATLRAEVERLKAEARMGYHEKHAALHSRATTAEAERDEARHELDTLRHAYDYERAAVDRLCGAWDTNVKLLEIGRGFIARAEASEAERDRLSEENRVLRERNAELEEAQRLLMDEMQGIARLRLAPNKLTDCQNGACPGVSLCLDCSDHQDAQALTQESPNGNP